MHHFPAQLSGGEQQRVAIARAVAKRPDVLLCDEPTGALDYATGKIVLEVLARVNRELGTTTAVITHNAAIAGMADRVVRMSSGRIVEVTAQPAPGLPGGALLVNARNRMLAARPLAPARPGARRRAGRRLRRRLVRFDARDLRVAPDGARRLLPCAALRRRLRPAEARARQPGRPGSREIPGVAAVRTRVVHGRDARRARPRRAGRRTAGLRFPSGGEPMLNDLHLARRPLRRTRASRRGDRERGLRRRQPPRARRPVGAVINGRWRQLTHRRRGALAEYIYEVGGGSIFPDNKRFGVLWMGEEALVAGFDMDGAFNDVALALSAGAVEADVIDRLDLALAALGRPRRLRARGSGLAPLHLRRDRAEPGHLDLHPGDLSRRRRLPAPPGAVAPGGPAAHRDRPAEGVRLRQSRRRLALPEAGRWSPCWPGSALGIGGGPVPRRVAHRPLSGLLPLPAPRVTVEPEVLGLAVAISLGAAAVRRLGRGAVRCGCRRR